MSYDIRNFTRSDYCYNYTELLSQATEEQVQAYCAATKDRFAPIARSFTNEDNSRWILRHFLALKFAISASILSGSAVYARDRNLLMGVPYFNYYALLNCCRAFLMTSPDVKWTGDTTIQMTHKKILNRTGDLMNRLNAVPVRPWIERLNLVREHRELYSYHFPGTGPGFVEQGACEPETTADFARLIAELAMLNSECFDASLSKHAPKEMSIPPLEDHKWAEIYKVAGVEVTDRSDKERFGKFVRLWGRVSTLQVMASDGLVEDFYGAWTSADGRDGDFDPDDHMSHLLTL